MKIHTHSKAGQIDYAVYSDPTYKLMNLPKGKCFVQVPSHPDKRWVTTPWMLGRSI